jgi:hypothetical protein
MEMKKETQTNGASWWIIMIGGLDADHTLLNHFMLREREMGFH